jgi:FtsP/CotA-like multicopper oxidase with cupredoxin domain
VPIAPTPRPARPAHSRHGQDLPGAAWADGVAGVSQNPIPAGKTFTYRFRAEPAGTFWYHSHTGEQYGDGLRGPLIVDDPKDPHKGLYDFDLDDHVLMLADVFSNTVAEQLRELQAGGMSMGGGGASMGGGARVGGAMGGGGNAMGGGGNAMGGRKLLQTMGGGMAGMAPAAAKPAPAKPAPAKPGAPMAGMAAAPAAPAADGMAGMAGMAGMGAAATEPAAAPAAKPAAGGMAGMAGGAAPAVPAAGHAGGAAAAASAAPPTTCPPEVLDQDISDAPWGGVQVNGRGGAAPLIITVKPGKSYRLRFIGGQSSWALRVGAGGGHKLTIIALDGRPVAPRPADAFVISSGERVDAVLAADKPVGNYWVDIMTLTGINSPAILHYEGAPEPGKDAKFLASRRAEFGCAAGVGGQPVRFFSRGVGGAAALWGARRRGGKRGLSTLQKPPPHARSPASITPNVHPPGRVGPQERHLPQRRARHRPQGAPPAAAGPADRAARAPQGLLLPPLPPARPTFPRLPLTRPPTPHPCLPQAASKTFVVYLPDAALMPPPARVLAGPLAPRAAAPVRGFSPSKAGCPPLPGGAKNNYCWCARGGGRDGGGFGEALWPCACRASRPCAPSSPPKPPPPPPPTPPPHPKKGP